MRVFLMSLIAVAVLAVGTGLVLEGFFARDADRVYAVSGVRVGAEGSVRHRDFAGRGQGGDQDREVALGQQSGGQQPGGQQPGATTGDGVTKTQR